MSQTVEMVVDSTPAIRNLDKITNSLKATANQYNQTQAIVEKANRKVAESSAAFQKATSAGLRYDASVKRWRTSTGQFATAAEKAAAGVNDLNKQLQVNNRLMSSSGKATADAVSRMRSLVLQVGAAYSAYKLLEKAVDAVNIGIQANQSWESQKLGIASVIGATNQLADAQGRVLQGSEKFAASQQVAEKLMERIQVLGLETVATTQDLVEGVQGIIAPATRVGIALEKVPDLAVSAAQAMGAMQIPLQQMRTEVEALLSGNINKAQDILATNLGITGEMVRNWQKQGVLLDEINKRLESFKLSGDALANTWGGLTSNLKEYVEFISRGATEGLFNSLKSSAREFQSLLISINEQTGRPEVSNKVNNLVAAYERLNDVIGNKILVSTMKFADWIEELNKPENISELENTLSNVWQTITDIGDIAGTAISKIGELSGKALEGFNNLPEWFREIGLVGAIVFGKRGWLALGAASALIDRGKDFARGIELFVESGQMSIQELTSLSWDKLHEMVDAADKATKEASEKSKQNFTSSASETTKSLKAEYEQRKRDLEDALEQEYRNLKAYQEASKVPLVGYIYEDKAGDSQEHINELQEKLSTINLQLEYTFEKSFAASQAVDHIGLATQHIDEMPLQQLVGSIHNLQIGADLFTRKLFGAKEAVNNLDGSTAIVSLDFQYTLPEKKDLGLFGASGGSASGWLKEQLDLLDNLGDRISATGSTAGKTADKAKSKIESALHSVESELNKLQMTDAQYKQWQINEKVEKLEKLLGKTNPKVVELRNALQKELDENLFKDTLQYANPTAAAVSAVKKEYEDWKKNLEQLKKQAPDKYNKLIAQNTNLMADAQREYNNALEQAEATYINFRKETADIRAQATMSDDEYFVFQTNRQIEEWKKQGQTKADIDERINALLLQHNQKYTADFAAMWEETYNRVDEAGADMLENFLNGSKNTFDSLKKMFIRTLAEMANAAWLRPITVQVMGALGSVFGVGGTALAYDSATGKMVNASGSGLLGNLPFSSLLPDSWTSGVSSFLSYELPGTAPGISGLYGPTMGGGNLASGLSLGSALMYGGLGSLGYSLLGGALGLPQNKYSGITSGLGAGLGAWGASAALSGTALGATLGSAVPVVGTVIGAALGGALGSLFGQKRKTHPSVYGHMMGLGYTTDTQTYIDAFMNQATYDRAGKTEASGYAQVIGEAASQTAGNILNLAAMLPEAYKQSVEDKLESATWSAGRGYSGASWNLQNWKEGMAEERIQEAIDDMFAQMGLGANKAFAEAGIGELFDSFDLSTEAGFKKAQTAISAISSITTAIDEIKAPTTEAEQQAKAFVEQMNALGEAVKASGLNAAYADKMIGEYRTAYVDKYVKTLEEMFNPLSQIEQQAKGYKEAIDGYVSALTTMGASEAQLAQVRGYTQDAINNITGSLDAAFFPLSEVETQTKATMESLLAYKAALETLGASAEELTRIDAAWGKMQADLLDKARAYVSTTPEVVSQTTAMNAEFDALREAMLLAGNATADLTELEQIRAQAVAALQAQYTRSFEQGLAQRYATLNGTSDAVSRAISQENELREAIQKFGEGSAQVAELLHVQAAENVYAAQASVDALQNQLNQLKTQAIQAEISALNEQMSAAKTLKDAWENLSKSLLDSRTKLWTSNTNALGLFARRDAAQSEFDRLYSLTMSGDKEAAAKLASSGDTLLSLLKETSANGEEYTAGFWNVEQKLKDAESVAGKQLSEAQKNYNALESQLKTQQSMLDALGLNNSSLDAINAQIVTVGQQLAEALGNLNIAQSNPNYGGTTSGGGFVSWQDKLLQEKADALNAGQTLAPGQTAGGWTPEKVLDAIKENGWTVSEWYEKFGKPEGFASGGITPRNRPFWVGEEGPELMMSPQQYGVLNTRDSHQLMMMPAVGTDGGATAIIAQLRENNAELKEQNRILYAMLLENQGTRKNTANTADSVENMVRTGVRARQQ